MKRIRLALILTAIVASFASYASASAIGSVELNLGYNKSSTELATTGETFGGGIGVGGAFWRPISPMVSWGAEVSWDNLGDIEAQYQNGSGANVHEKLNAKVIRANPALRMNFGSVVGPSFFAQGGAGLYNVSWKYEYSDDTPLQTTAEDSQSKFGFNLAGGFSFPMGPKTRMNLSGAYHIIPKPDNTNVDNMNNFQARAGLAFGL